jgi:hypothetical protein
MASAMPQVPQLHCGFSRRGTLFVLTHAPQKQEVLCLDYFAHNPFTMNILRAMHHANPLVLNILKEKYPGG